MKSRKIFLDGSSFNSRYLFEYFDVNGIDFQHLSDDLKHILDHPNDCVLILGKMKLKSLLLDDRFDEFGRLAGDGKIKIIFFGDNDDILGIQHWMGFGIREYENQTVVKNLQKLKLTWWAGGKVGKKMLDIFPNSDCTEFLYPYIVNTSYCHFGSRINFNHNGDKSFLCLNRATGVKGIEQSHRSSMIESIKSNGLDRHSLIYTEPTKNDERFARLLGRLSASEFGDRFVRNTPIESLNSLPKAALYDQTNYELIIETLGAMDNDDSFGISPNTINCIIMGHPFLVLSNKYFLGGLRQMGFRTFDGLVNESYDVKDDQQRIQIITENIKMMEQDLGRKFYHNSREITKHNQKHLQNLIGQSKYDLWKKFNNFFQ